ncbi:contact-dependent growth inhibition system immunity protein [Streptomyces sp. enrichment culture]|uniref:contact-dependent growth inhibition system immunity protein n=1 Tax=Streptomyces sp. enrichment culture TaxID=1795815 RepID=UPI003F564193
MGAYPCLRLFAQTYFHQDFALEADEPIAIVAHFRRAASLERTQELRAEVLSILDAVTDDEAVARIWLKEAGAYYDPRPDGITPRNWLRRIAAELEEGDTRR